MSTNSRRGPQAEPAGVEMTAAGLVALGVSAVYVAIAWAHGALGTARADDWSYYRTAFVLAKRGTFELNGWASMMLIGHTVLAWPVVKVFGPRIAPLQVAVAIMGAAGLWASYLVIRSFLSRGWAALALACLAVGPVYGTLSVSFMTDVPSFAFQALAVLAGLRALRPPKPSMRWFVVSLGLGLVAFTVREYAVVAGLAVGVVVFQRARATDRQLARRIVAVATGWLVVLVALYVWRKGLANSITYTPAMSSTAIRHAVTSTFHAALTLGLFVSPAVLAMSPFRLVAAAWDRARIGSGAVVIVLVALAASSKPLFVGNYFARIGSYTVLLPGTKPAIVAPWAWDLLGLVGFASLVALGLLASVTVADRRAGSPAPSAGLPTGASAGRALVMVFCALTVVVTVAVITFTTAPLYDRYLIVLVPFVAALTIQTAQDRQLVARRAGVAATAAVVALTLVGLTWLDASASFDGGRWQLAESVQRLGYRPATIDAGLEWFGYQQPDDVHTRPTIPGRNFWVTEFSPRPVCVTLTLPSPGGMHMPGAEVAPR